MTGAQILLTVGPLASILLICFLVVWALTEIRWALVYLAVILGVMGCASALAFFWIWVAGVVT